MRVRRSGAARTSTVSRVAAAAAQGGDEMANDQQMTREADVELRRLCDLLDLAASDEQRTATAVRICDALGVPCGRK